LNGIVLRNTIKPFVILIATVNMFSVHAASQVPPEQEAGGFSKRPSLIVKHNPDKVRQLLFKFEDIYSANQVAKNPSNMALLVIKNGKVLHESYNHPKAHSESLFFSMSISKSLTAYSLANLICSGKVDIHKPVGYYTSELRNTTWDSASLRDVLRMSSGAKIPKYSGQLEKNQFRNTTKHILSMNEIMHRNGERTIEPGIKFNYMSADTSAIERVIAAVSNEKNGLKEFKTQVWDQVGAESDAKWNIDKAGALNAYAGFSATLRDWGRLGLWSLAKNSEDSCEGRFHKEANTQQIINHKERQGKAFKGYGYQVWIRNDHEYWWVGHGGQRVGINTEKNAVIVAFSYVEDYMTDLYKLMDEL